jgi:hypothetical protein
MFGEVNSLIPAAAASAENPAFGTVSRTALEVVQPDWAPVEELVHPGGKFGALTPSKF